MTYRHKASHPKFLYFARTNPPPPIVSYNSDETAPILKSRDHSGAGVPQDSHAERTVKSETYNRLILDPSLLTQSQPEEQTVGVVKTTFPAGFQRGSYFKNRLKHRRSNLPRIDEEHFNSSARSTGFEQNERIRSTTNLNESDNLGIRLEEIHITGIDDSCQESKNDKHLVVDHLELKSILAKLDILTKNRIRQDSIENKPRTWPHSPYSVNKKLISTLNTRRTVSTHSQLTNISLCLEKSLPNIKHQTKHLSRTPSLWLMPTRGELVEQLTSKPRLSSPPYVKITPPRSRRRNVPLLGYVRGVNLLPWNDSIKTRARIVSLPTERVYKVHSSNVSTCSKSSSNGNSNQ